MRRIRLLFDAMAERKGQTKAIGKALSISAINQVVSSGTNFALGIYLVRVLTPTDFGLYGIGFAISLLYAGVGNALFLTQMVVHVPDKAQEDRLPYAARMLVALALFCALTVPVVGLLMVLGGAWSQLLHEYVDLGMAVTAASIAYLLKDFFVRHAYTARKEIWALVVNVIVAFALVALLMVQHQFPTGIDSTGALWIYAASNMAGAIIGMILVRLPILAVRMQELIDDVREAWVGGSWALGGVAIIWAQTQAYMYVTAFFIGPAGVGYANAARLLITPALFLMPALTQIAMPRLAELRTKNTEKMLRISRMFTAGIVSFAVVYSAILLGLVDVIAPVLLGAKYTQIAPLVAAWCLVLIFQFSRSGTSIVLQVMKEFKRLTLINTGSVMVAIGAAVALMQIVGVQGAILGTAAGELILSFLLYKAIRSKCNGLR